MKMKRQESQNGNLSFYKSAIFDNHSRYKFRLILQAILHSSGWYSDNR